MSQSSMVESWTQKAYVRAIEKTANDIWSVHFGTKSQENEMKSVYQEARDSLLDDEGLRQLSEVMGKTESYESRIHIGFYLSEKQAIALVKVLEEGAAGENGIEAAGVAIAEIKGELDKLGRKFLAWAEAEDEKNRREVDLKSVVALEKDLLKRLSEVQEQRASLTSEMIDDPSEIEIDDPF